MMFATIYLPNFFLQAAIRHESLSRDVPIALIEAKEKKPNIIQLNHAAEIAGVRVGMAPSQALARCLSLQIKIRSPIREDSLANIVLHHAFRLSPLVEATGPGIWTIQFTDNRELSAKISTVLQQLSQLEIFSQSGIAITPDLSFLAAHLARPILQIDHPEEFLAPLSIDVLAIPFQH